MKKHFTMKIIGSSEMFILTLQMLLPNTTTTSPEHTIKVVIGLKNKTISIITDTYNQKINK